MLTTSASGDTRAARQLLIDLTFAPESLPKLSKGAKVVSVEPGWPKLGSKLAFKLMGARMEACITEVSLPESLTMTISAPSGVTTVHHRFLALDGGGSRLEKTVEMKDGLLNKVILALFLRRQLRNEVDRNIALADEATRK